MMRGFHSYGGFDRFGQGGFQSAMGQFWWVGMLVHLLVWVAVILLVIWIVRQFIGKKSVKNELPVKDDNALAIIRERFAKGEITKEEFEQLKKDLE